MRGIGSSVPDPRRRYAQNAMAMLTRIGRMRAQNTKAGPRRPVFHRTVPPNDMESPVPKRTAWIALPDVATTKGSDTTATTAPDEKKKSPPLPPRSHHEQRRQGQERELLRGDCQPNEHARPDPLTAEGTRHAGEHESQGDEVLRMEFVEQGHPYHWDQGEEHDSERLPSSVSATRCSQQCDHAGKEHEPAPVPQANGREDGGGVLRPIDTCRNNRGRSSLRGPAARETTPCGRSASAPQDRPT